MSALFCIFMITINAEAPALYIEFQVELADSDTPVTVYVENTEAINYYRALELTK